MEKNSLEKVRKHVFYKHTNINTKKWREKNAKTFFSRNTRISRVLNDGKKSSGKSAKKRFFINTWILWQKMGENRGKQFFQKHRAFASINDGKKSSGKSAKHVFYKHTNIQTKKWGEKTREKFFPETHVYREL